VSNDKYQAELIKKIAVREYELAKLKYESAKSQAGTAPAKIQELELAMMKAELVADPYLEIQAPPVHEILVRPGDEEIPKIFRDYVTARRMAGDDPLPTDRRDFLRRQHEDAQRFADSSALPDDALERYREYVQQRAEAAEAPQEPSDEAEHPLHASFGRMFRGG
jgi:hypothetical protein